MLVDGACYAYSMVTVPLYDTLGPDAVQYICSHAELAAVAVSAPLLPTLLPCLASVPTVKLVVRARPGSVAFAGCYSVVHPTLSVRARPELQQDCHMDWRMEVLMLRCAQPLHVWLRARLTHMLWRLSPEAVTTAPQIVFGQKSGQRLPSAGPHGIQIRTLDEVRAAGEQHPTPHVPPAPDATATLCYTSGTTGVPKGAVLRHSAMVANAVGTMFCFPLETGARARVVMRLLSPA